MRQIFIGLVLVVCIGEASAAEQLAYGPIPAWVHQSSLPASTEEPTDAAIRILLVDQQFSFSPTANETYVETLVRVQNPQGLTAMGTLSLPWKPDTDVLTVHKLRILRGDQHIDVLGSGQSFTILRRENNLEYAALDGVLTATIQPSGLQVGDTINLAYSLKRADPVLAGASEQIVSGWQDIPIANTRLRARWEKPTTIRWRTSDTLKGAKEARQGDATEVSLEMKNVEPLLQPRGAPFRYRVDREIEFSSYKSWSDISRRLGPLYDKAARLSAESPLRAEVARIRAESNDPGKRAAAALALVENQVRYVFLGMNDGAMVPADADVTWSRRFGDCKAKTVLLMALLRELGFEATPVAVNSITGDGLNSRLPMVGLFDHVIVRASFQDRMYWLDGTRIGDTNLSNLVTPDYRWGLPLLPAGSELVRIEAEPLAQPASTTHVDINAADGIKVPAPIRVDTVLKGDAAIALNSQLVNLTASDLDRGLREFWGKGYPDVKIHSVSAKFDEQLAEERLTMEGSIDMDWKDRWYEIEGARLGYKADYSRSSGPNDSAPFAVAFPTYSLVRHTIRLPNHGAGFTISGEDIDRTVAGLAFRRRATLVNGQFDSEASVRSISREFPALEAEQAQQVLSDMWKQTLHLREPENRYLTAAELAAELARTPTSAKEYLARGIILLNRSDYDRAIADLDQAIALDEKSDYAWANRGMSYALKRNAQSAQQDLDQALSLNPRNEVALRGKGVVAASAGDFEQAIEAFTRSLELDPGNSFALESRARAYASKRDFDKALADTIEVTRKRPEYAPMYSMRADLYRAQRKFDQVAGVADALIAANPTDSNAYYAASHIYASAGRTTEALNAAGRMLELEPSERAYYLRAYLRPSSDEAGRTADIDAALKLNPKSTPALAFRATMQASKNQFAEAIQTYSEAIQSTSDNEHELLYGRGIVYAKSGQTALALQDFAAAERKAPNAVALNNICWAMATAGIALDEALRICDAALAKGRWPAYLDSRGLVLLRLGRYGEAIEAYTEALTALPDLASSLYGRGIARRRNGDVSGGDADLAAALKLNPRVSAPYDAYGVQP